MKKVELYRRRFIPDEIVHLKDDVIEYLDENIIITRWKVLRPKKEFVGGRSCYFLNEGFKVSRFLNSAGDCIYTYCDIISTERGNGTYVFNDLLVDVVVYEDGEVRVLDLGEISQALDSGLITVEMAKLALSRTDRLLSIIYAGEFERLTRYLDTGESDECAYRTQKAR